MTPKKPIEHGAMLTLRIAPEIIERIDEEARKQQRTRANMVRVIINAYFDKGAKK